MRPWIQLANRPILTIVLAAIWAAILWALYYPGEESTAPQRSFAYQRYADAGVLVSLVREEYPPALVTAFRLSPEALQKDTARVFDRAVETGVFPDTAAKNWAILFHGLGDRVRAEQALRFLPESAARDDPTADLLTRWIAGIEPLPQDQLRQLAELYETKETTLPDWFFLARFGGNHEVQTWLEERGRALVRRGVISDVLTVLFLAVSVIALLCLVFRKDLCAHYPVSGRLERSWGTWPFYRQAAIAELLALSIATILPMAFYAGGAASLGILSWYLTQSSILLLWMFSCLTPGIRAGLVHFLPEFRSGSRNRATTLRSRLRQSVLSGLAGLAVLFLACLLIYLTDFGVEALEDSFRPDTLDHLPSILVNGFAAVVLAPFTEEIFFRGFLYGAIRARVGPVPAALISSVIFALVHGYTFAGFVHVFGFGLIFAWIYQRTGSLLPGMVAHGLLNLVLTSGLVGWYSLH